jgi:hypothetical protein
MVARRTIGTDDVVALLQAAPAGDGVGQWRAGTVGKVIDELGEHKLVEICNDEGRFLDFVSVRARELALVERGGHEWIGHYVGGLRSRSGSESGSDRQTLFARHRDICGTTSR